MDSKRAGGHEPDSRRDGDGAKHSRAAIPPTGTVAVRLELAAKDAGSALRFELRSVSAVMPDGEPIRAPVSARELVLGRPGPNMRTFLLELPEGNYRGLGIHAETLAKRPNADAEWEQVARDVVMTIEEDFHPSAATTVELVLTVDVERLDVDDGRVTRGVTATIEHIGSLVRARMTGAAGDLVLRAASGLHSADRLFMLSFDEATFKSGINVAMRPRRTDGLPQLFDGQRRVGPVVEVESDGEPADFVKITVPYDEDAVHALGLAPSELIVMHLETDESVYHELRPIRIDAQLATLTVRSPSLSTFFACTPGILVDHPEFYRTRHGETLVIDPGPDVTIAGRTVQADADVTLVPDDSAGAWSRLGLFEFPGNPIAGREQSFVLTAVTDGRIPHNCEVVVRKPSPPKLVARAARLFGTKLAVGDDNVPHVSAVRIRTGATDPGVDLLAYWLESVEWNTPVLHWPRADSTGWHERPLLPASWFANEMARRAIEVLNQVDGPVPVDDGAPAETRYVRAMEAFIGDAGEGALAVAVVLEVAKREIPVSDLTLSPATPLVCYPDGRTGAAFVAATTEGIAAASRSGMASEMAAIYAPRRVNGAARVLAGSLLYVEVDNGEVGEPEEVADGVWCATVALRRDPATGEPAILALLVEDDAGDEPRSRLALFQRVDGNWQVDPVWSDQPIVDADFAISDKGEYRIVASTSGTNELKGHIHHFTRSDVGWRSDPIIWTGPWPLENVDLGSWPRITIDAEGRSVVAFMIGHPDAFWFLAVQDGTLWDTVLVRSGFRSDLTGTIGHTYDPGFEQEAIGQSGFSFAHWAPSVTITEPGRAAYVTGGGALHLTHIDLTTQEVVNDVGVDVDRRTGFSVDIAQRPNGASVIAYKDAFGTGDDSDTTVDDLHLFSSDTGKFVPRRDPPDWLQPGHHAWDLSIGAFDQPVPLTCDRILGIPLSGLSANDLVASVIMHRRFHVLVHTGEGTYDVTALNLRRSHGQLATMIDQIPRAIPVTQITIDNSNRVPNEDIERIDLTTFGPLANVAGGFDDELNQPRMPEALRLRIIAAGIQLSPLARLDVTVVSQGTAWDVNDRRAFRAGTTVTPQLYHIVKKDDRYEIGISPLLTVTTAVDERNIHGQLTPCGLTQDNWDANSGDLTSRLANAVPRLGGGIDGVRTIKMRNMEISRFRPDTPHRLQQGGMEFRVSIPHITFEGRRDGANFDGHTTGPSHFDVTFAPYVRDGRVFWYERRFGWNLSEVDVDVDTGFWGFLAFTATLFVSALFPPALIPGLVVTFGLDPVVDHVITNKANDALTEPNVDGFSGLLQSTLTQFVNDRLGDNFIEAVYLDQWFLTVFSRLPVRHDFAISSLHMLPTDFMSVGRATIGQNPSRRRAVLMSTGSLPIALEDIVVTDPGGEFSAVPPRTWPRVMEPGDAEELTIEFAPALQPGFRAGALDVTYNGGRRLHLDLSAIADPPPLPAMRLAPPDVLNFGIGLPGADVVRDVVVHNDGQAPLDIAALTIEPVTAADDGVFELVTAPPLTVLNGTSRPISIRYHPQEPPPNRSDARLAIESNDPTMARAIVQLFGVGAPTDVRVVPPNIEFGDELLFPLLQASLPADFPPDLLPILGGMRTFTVYNQGATNVTLVGNSLVVVNGAGAPDPLFTLLDLNNDEVPQVDQPLPAGGYFTITVRFRPLVEGDVAASLVLQFAGAQVADILVPITGRGST